MRNTFHLKKNYIRLQLIDVIFLTSPPGFQQVANGIGYSPEARSFVPLFQIFWQDNEAKTYYGALQ